jgi:hypothetical protein
MKNQTILTIVFSFFFIGWHCGGDDNPITPTAKWPGFYGTVKDQNGTIISDVNVYYNFMCRSLAKSSNPNGTFLIQFSLPESSYVSLNLFKLGSRDTMAKIIDGYRSAGTYSVGYDFSNLPNAIYTFYLITKYSFSRIDYIHQAYDYNVLFNTTPITKSRYNGTFELRYDSLGVNRNFGSKYVTDSIDIILYKQGYQVLKTGFRMDSTKAIENIFVLSK